MLSFQGSDDLLCQQRGASSAERQGEGDHPQRVHQAGIHDVSARQVASVRRQIHIVLWLCLGVGVRERRTMTSNALRKAHKNK